MKKLLNFLFYFATTALLFAQSNSLDTQLSNINHTSVTSGIIYDRVLKLGNFYNFNKSTDFNSANADYFRQILSEMNRASNNTKLLKFVEDG